MRNFWNLFLSEFISFKDFNSSCSLINDQINKTDKGYRNLIERYPSMSNVYESYAAFLENVMNNSSSAAKYTQKGKDILDDGGAPNVKMMTKTQQLSSELEEAKISNKEVVYNNNEVNESKKTDLETIKNKCYGILILKIIRQMDKNTN